MQDYQKLSKVEHIAIGASKTVEYLTKSWNGEIKAVPTSFPKLNKALMDGIDWYRIMSIAGLSGAGKSTFLENLKEDFKKSGQKLRLLSFEFEMRIEDSLIRVASANIGKSTKEILKGELTEEEKAKVLRTLAQVKTANQHYIDSAMTVDEIISTIKNFVLVNKMLANDEGLVVSLDHTLLTKGRTGESEKAVIDSLMKELVALKKEFASVGLRCVFIVLSQLNRDIESTERVMNCMVHYPTRNDLFASSSVYYSSDYVMIIHRPSKLAGMSQYYGPPREGSPKGLPVYTEEGKSMVYGHLIKERFGEECIIPFVEDFAKSKITEL